MGVTGFDFSRYTEEGDGSNAYIDAADLQLTIDNPVKPSGFAYICGWTGYYDDYKFGAHRKLLVNAHSSLYGALLWGAYMEVAYGSTSRSGEGQAANFWSLISSGGIEWQLPPWVCLEDFSSDPRIPLAPYLDTKVMPAIQYLADKMGMLPMIYTGPNYLKNYLRPARQIAKYDELWQCPLACARYMNVPEPVGCANPLIAPTYNLTDLYPTWAMWQYYGDYKQSPGLSDLDWILWRGDREQLVEWAKDYTKGIPPIVIPETSTWATVMGDHLMLRDTPGDDGEHGTGAALGVMAKGATWKVDQTFQGQGFLWAHLPGGWVATGDQKSELALLDQR